MTNPKRESLDAGRFFVGRQDCDKPTALEVVGPFRRKGLHWEVI